MIKATIINPTLAELELVNEDFDNLVKFTQYKNTSLEFQLKKHLKNRWWKSKNPKTWEQYKKNLESKTNRSLLEIHGNKIYIKPGFIPYLKERYEVETVNKIQYPTPRPYPWYKPLKVTPYPYQKESLDKLIEAKHGCIELFTGAGKSVLLLMLTQKLGLKTLIVTPSVSIFEEMLERFEYHFGKSTIGALGGGKKRLGRNIIICVSDSVANLKEGTKEYDEISSFEMASFDESHTLPSLTLEKMCHGVLKNIPYRFFVSGTQTRGDGTEKLLKSIIGQNVFSMYTKEGIQGGFICNHEFKIVTVESTRPSFWSDDALEMKRVHFLRNDNIAKFIGKLANSVYGTKKEQTLVLVDEIEQIHNLIKYLEVPYACATGDKSFDKPSDAVEKFNKGEARVLIGTSCISTGTNIFPTHHTVNWQGGTSEIKVKQGAVGRSVRKLESSEYAHLHVPKLKATIWDFNVRGIETMKRQLKTRIGFYEDSGTRIIFV